MPGPSTASEDEGQDKGLRLVGVLQDVLARGILVVDAKATVVAISPEAERLIQLPASSVLHKSSDVLPEALRHLIAESFTTGRGVPGRQIAVAAKAPTESITLIAGTMVTKIDSDAQQVTVVLSDANTLLTLETRLQRLNRFASAGMVTAGLTHEIKNALVPIKILLESFVESNSGKELGAVATRELDRINSIISQILRFTKASGAKLVPVKVHEALNQSLRLVRHQATDNNVLIKSDFVAPRDVVQAEPSQIEQAFLNVFLNAIAAMEGRGELRIRTENHSLDIERLDSKDTHSLEWIKVIVIDTGGGIPPENLERIFEPFYTTKPEGTGLGLAFTRRIVREHGGHISVDSQEGKGARFEIDLPLLPPVASAESA